MDEYRPHAVSQPNLHLAARTMGHTLLRQTTLAVLRVWPSETLAAAADSCGRDTGRRGEGERPIEPAPLEITAHPYTVVRGAGWEGGGAHAHGSLSCTPRATANKARPSPGVVAQSEPSCPPHLQKQLAETHPTPDAQQWPIVDTLLAGAFSRQYETWIEIETEGARETAPLVKARVSERPNTMSMMGISSSSVLRDI